MKVVYTNNEATVHKGHNVSKFLVHQSHLHITPRTHRTGTLPLSLPLSLSLHLSLHLSLPLPDTIEDRAIG